MTPAQAARALGVHPNTVYSWCHKALDGEETPLEEVKKNPYNGYFTIKVSPVSTEKDK